MIRKLKEDWYDYDDEGNDIEYFSLRKDEDGVYYACGDTREIHANSLAQLIEEIKDHAHTNIPDVYSDYEINTDRVDWDENDPDDLGSVEVTYYASREEEEDEESEELNESLKKNNVAALFY